MAAPDRSKSRIPWITKACDIRAVLTALATAVCGALPLRLVPGLEVELFAQAAARLAALLTGAPVARVSEGWLLPSANLPVVVSAECSGAGFFIITATLVAWQLARRRVFAAIAIGIGLTAALPLSVVVNAARVVVVTQAHRWVIPLLPDTYALFLHMLAGMAVFLPSLIAINLVLESHARIRTSATTGAR